MKKVLSPVLLVLAFPIFAGGVFEIEGIMGMPNLPWALTLTLTAQMLVLIAGQLAAPTKGTISFIRAVACTLFFVGALALPRILLLLVSEKLRHVVILESQQVVWGLVESLVSIMLLVYSAKAWHLSEYFRYIGGRRLS